MSESHVLRAIIAVASLLACCSSPASVDPPVQPLATISNAGQASNSDGVARLDGAVGCEVAARIDGSDRTAALELGVGLLEGTDPDADTGLEGCAVAASPLCAGLFLIAATDPLIWFATTPETSEIDRLIALHERALLASAALAGGSGDRALETALTELVQLDATGAFALGDVALAELAVARDEPAILDPIVAAEANC